MTQSVHELNPDGSGHWGPLEFAADGTMSADAPGWTTITSFRSGYSSGAAGWVPAYRLWPSGKVEWRGVVAGGHGTAFTIPAEARPQQDTYVAAAANRNASGGGLCRVVFTASGNCRTESAGLGPPLTWASLDGIPPYYVSVA
ncbi:MAG: hypothetical protein ACRDQA_15720 [Nocardioidaceae bacterium]